MCQFTCRIKSQWPNRQAQEGMPSQSSKHYQTALHRGRTRSHPLSTHQAIRLPLEGEKSFLFCSLSFEAKGSASQRPFSSGAASCPVRPPPPPPGWLTPEHTLPARAHPAATQVHPRGGFCRNKKQEALQDCPTEAEALRLSALCTAASSSFRFLSQQVTSSQSASIACP